MIGPELPPHLQRPKSDEEEEASDNEDAFLPDLPPDLKLSSTPTCGPSALGSSASASKHTASSSRPSALTPSRPAPAYDDGRLGRRRWADADACGRGCSAEEEEEGRVCGFVRVVYMAATSKYMMQLGGDAFGESSMLTSRDSSPPREALPGAPAQCGAVLQELHAPGYGQLRCRDDVRIFLFPFLTPPDHPHPSTFACHILP